MVIIIHSFSSITINYQAKPNQTTDVCFVQYSARMIKKRTSLLVEFTFFGIFSSSRLIFCLKPSPIFPAFQLKTQLSIRAHKICNTVYNKNDI